MPLLIPLNDHTPALHPTSWAAPNASLIGWIEIDARASIWYSATVRAERDRIHIGEGSNVQDNATIHSDPGYGVVIGKGVTVGHNAVLHGCTVEDDALIGMGAIVLNGAVIGAGSIVAAGALIPQGAAIPPRSLVAGVPGRARRAVTQDEYDSNLYNAADYRELADAHRTAIANLATGHQHGAG